MSLSILIAVEIVSSFFAVFDLCTVMLDSRLEESIVPQMD